MFHSLPSGLYRFVVVIVVLSGSVCAEAGDAGTGWKAGVASVVITPERPMLMCGGISKKPSEGKIHDLHAKALAIEDSKGTRLVIVTLDVAMIPMSLRKEMEEEVARRCRLAPESLLLNASHTHSGPETRAKRAVLYGFPPEEIQRIRDYVQWLKGRLSGLVERSIANLAPATLAYSCAKADFACNRRLKTPSGYTMRRNPDGPVDHDVPILAVRSPEGKLRAVLFGYACHAVAFKTHKFCGDFPGFAQAYLEEAYPGAAALFMTGCGGDQRPYPTGAMSSAQQYGRALADAVQTGLKSKPRPVRGPLRVALEQVPLKLDTPPTREQLQRQAKSSNGIQRRRAETLLKELDENGKLRTSYPYHIHVARFGDDLIMVALAWEVVVDYSLRLKAELAGPAVWVAGYSNEIYNYLPSLRVLKEGGYEAGGSLLSYSTVPARFAPSIEKTIVDKVHELARKKQPR